MTQTTTLGPTTEQRRRCRFERRQVTTKRGQVVGVAWTRRPWFETLALRSGDISDDDLRALRLYRDAYETTAHSETRCALNRQPGGGNGDGPGLLLIMAAERLRLAEWGLSRRHVNTLRAVAIHDQKFADVAIARWGSRVQLWCRAERARPWVEKIVPKNRASVARVRREFMAALEALERNVRPLLRTASGLDFRCTRAQPPRHPQKSFQVNAGPG